MLKDDKNKDQNIHSNDEKSEYVDLELSLPEQYENIVSDVQKEVMMEELEEFAPIKENDINISTTYLYDDGDEIEAKIYFRNGFARKVNFEYVPLILVNSKEEILAKKTFDLREMGDIPPKGARPWKISFLKSEVNMEKFLAADCKIMFDAHLKAVNYANIELELDESMKLHRTMFENFLKELPRIERGNVSLSKFSIALANDGRIIVTLMVRNSTDKNIKIEKLPITLKDENNNITASGNFNLDGFEVPSMKAKVCTLAFSTDLVIDKTISLDKWEVVFK